MRAHTGEGACRDIDQCMLSLYLNVRFQKRVLCLIDCPSVSRHVGARPYIYLDVFQSSTCCTLLMPTPSCYVPNRST